MRPPFTIDQFLDVFRQYNEAMWPSQWLLLVLALAATALALRGLPHDGRTVSGILAFLWLWVGLIYHLAFYSSLSSGGILFAAVFIAEAVLLVAFGVYQGRLVFRARADAAGFIGLAIVVYALVIYPLLGYAFGHRYPGAPTFGVPCPTTIFTLGILVWAIPPVPWVVLIAPIVWAAVATSAALQLGMYEDVGLSAAALIVVALNGLRGRRLPRHGDVTAGKGLVTP